eukprot:402427-Amphidinium_carterae.1
MHILSNFGPAKLNYVALEVTSFPSCKDQDVRFSTDVPCCASEESYTWQVLTIHVLERNYASGLLGDPAFASAFVLSLVSEVSPDGCIRHVSFF